MNRLRKIPFAFSFVCAIALNITACNSKSIVVPNSDTTPPTISLAVDFTTSSGQRKTVTLTQNGSDVSFDLDPNEPIAILASARDNNGGVLDVKIIAGITDICQGDNLSTDIFAPGDFLNTGGPGDTAPTLRLDQFTFNPLDRCPSGNSRAAGFISAHAENYHNLTSDAPSFNFQYK